MKSICYNIITVRNIGDDNMEHKESIQRTLDFIDERITDKITIRELAKMANFSVCYFCRIFSATIGMPVMLYVTRRKLQYALYDLCHGKKVIDVAMEYGFETHAGFTKAFKRCFGYPPSLCRLHTDICRPKKIELSQSPNNLTGGIVLHTQILEKSPFIIVGFINRYTLPNVKHTFDIPTFWETVNMEYSDKLSRLHQTFTKSRHNEYGVCFDADVETGEFTYLLGVGVDNNEDLKKIEGDMYKKEMPGGFYAVFTTPLVKEENYTQSVQETWHSILNEWLPNSNYEFDEERYDFEYYDERDHAWEHNGMAQMDICIPICKRKA